MTDDYARCPSCRTSDSIVVTEVHEEIWATDPGRHEIRDGQVIPASEFMFGDPGHDEFRAWLRKLTGAQLEGDTYDLLWLAYQRGARKRAAASTPGDPVRVEMGCERCGHNWRARRTVGMRVETLGTGRNDG